MHVLENRYDLTDSIEQISSELNADMDTDLLDKCAEYFSQKEDYNTAVKLLAMAKKVSSSELLVFSKMLQYSI